MKVNATPGREAHSAPELNNISSLGPTLTYAQVLRKSIGRSGTKRTVERLEPKANTTLSSSAILGTKCNSKPPVPPRCGINKLPAELNLALLVHAASVSWSTLRSLATTSSTFSSVYERHESKLLNHWLSTLPKIHRFLLLTLAQHPVFASMDEILAFIGRIDKYFGITKIPDEGLALIASLLGLDPPPPIDIETLKAADLALIPSLPVEVEIARTAAKILQLVTDFQKLYTEEFQSTEGDEHAYRFLSRRSSKSCGLTSTYLFYFVKKRLEYQIRKQCIEMAEWEIDEEYEHGHLTDARYDAINRNITQDE